MRSIIGFGSIYLSGRTYVKVVQSVFSRIVRGQTRTSLSPCRIKTCLYTEFFIFREVPPNLRNEAKNNLSINRKLVYKITVYMLCMGY